MSSLRVFTGSSNVDLARKICSKLNIGMNQLDIRTFSNGNLSVQILENVREKDVRLACAFCLVLSLRVYVLRSFAEIS